MQAASVFDEWEFTMSTHEEFIDFKREVIGRLGSIDQQIAKLAKANGKPTPNWVFLASVVFSLLAAIGSGAAWLRANDIKIAAEATARNTELILEVRRDMKEFSTRVWGTGGIREEQLRNSQWIEAQKSGGHR
jgi:phosphoribosylformimino-5-aminoimidazole carboxamide ribonucleotide (ProFAR) isomerase